MITDQFGTEIKIGDTICFTLSMRRDQKPTVRATITDFHQGGDEQFVKVSYLPSPAVEWATREKKLPGMVGAWRVVKCW